METNINNKEYKYFYLITYFGDNNSTGVMELLRKNKIKTYTDYKEVKEYIGDSLKKNYNILNPIISNIVELRNK